MNLSLVFAIGWKKERERERNRERERRKVATTHVPCLTTSKMSLKECPRHSRIASEAVTGAVKY